MSRGMRVLTTADAELWDETITRLPAYDVYHLAAYHRLAELAGEGSARLFIHEAAAGTIALPLLLRPIDQIPGLAEAGAGWLDATSVYGYAGPVGSQSLMPPEPVAEFRSALLEELRARQVVTVFSRLHPLLAQSTWLDGLGSIFPGGQTISIDLAQPDSEHARELRDNHHRNLAKATRAGLRFVPDLELARIDEFRAVYEETMLRVGAAGYYFFSQRYYLQLFRSLGDRARLFFVENAHGEIAAGGIFFFCNGVVQYHLGGTSAAFSSCAPMILLTEHVRHLARAEGCRILHLGGGVGSAPDSLFHFKAGFSPRRHQFATWRWILDEEKFRHFCTSRAGWNLHAGHETIAPGYFPAYRAASAPTTARAVHPS